MILQLHTLFQTFVLKKCLSSQLTGELQSAEMKIETATLITSVARALKVFLNWRLDRHYSICGSLMVLCAGVIRMIRAAKQLQQINTKF